MCGGNTCRSPIAAALAAHLLRDAAFVESAGIDADTGAPAHPNAICVMKEKGIDITKHRSTNIEDLDLGAFDIVVALRPAIADTLSQEFDLHPPKLMELDIDDPFNKPLEKYRLCMNQIETTLLRLPFMAHAR